MKERFFQKESFYSHGIIVPFVALYFAWIRLKKINLSNFPLIGSKTGLAVIIFSLLLNFFATITKIHFLMGISLILFLAGIILYFYGKKMLKVLLFPIIFLFFMVPLPTVILARISFILKIISTKLACLETGILGINTQHFGSYVYLPNGETLLIGEPCSGLRSIISLFALAFIFTQFLPKGFWRKSILLISSIPIAIITNSIRISLSIIFGSIYGVSFATGKFHDISGILIFGIALGMFVYLKNLIA
jgi:exosortase